MNLNIAVKSRENKDEENDGGVELQPFLGSNADKNSTGMYWSNAKKKISQIRLTLCSQLKSGLKLSRAIVFLNSFIVTNHLCFV